MANENMRVRDLTNFIDLLYRTHPTPDDLRFIRLAKEKIAKELGLVVAKPKKAPISSGLHNV